MKKTLITLMALASCAMGAEAVVSADFAVTDFSTYKTTTISESGWTVNNTNSNVTAGESLEFTNDVLFVAYNGESLHNNNVVFTFIIDGLSSNAGNNVLYTIHTWGGNNALGLCLDSGTTGVLTGVSGGSQWPDGRNQDITIPDGEFALTVAHTSNGTKVYVDGELMATISGLQYTGDAHTMKQLNLGNTSTGGNGMDFTLSGLYIHNQTLTDNQVASFVASLAAPSTPAVPEPATATLSLLALAGLAARRRRK